MAERIEGGIWGLLIGDAVGVPYEFHPPEALPPSAQLEMEPPVGFARAHATVPPGTWSDDGAQALCLLRSLLDKARFDEADFAAKLLAWRERGYLAVDGRVFDIGTQTAQALDRLRQGTPAHRAGGADERSNGNGSLMRVLPLALWCRAANAKLVELAHAQSRLTHAHARAEVACALYCLWARAELDGYPDAYGRALETLGAIYATSSRTHAQELDAHFMRPRIAPQGTGYVVDCLLSAREACREGSYEATIKRAIAFGHDTDTTACVAGGIAGIRYGVRAIPARWRERLRSRDVAALLVKELLADLRGAGGEDVA